MLLGTIWYSVFPQRKFIGCSLVIYFYARSAAKSEKFLRNITLAEHEYVSYSKYLNWIVVSSLNSNKVLFFLMGLIYLHTFSTKVEACYMNS